MERDSLCRSLKDHRACNSSSSSNNNNKKLKDSWSYSSQRYGVDQDYLNGFSWPPRSYTCSFCKREFRSAQALGGHMNVHRRDRARLRQSPPRDAHAHGQFNMLNLDLSRSPNPSFSPPLPSLVSPPLSALSSPSFASPSEIKKWAMDGSILSPKGSDLTKMRTHRSFFDKEEIDGFVEEEDECKFLREGEIVRLDLEIGLLSDSKEDLDLELRLGYS